MPKNGEREKRRGKEKSFIKESIINNKKWICCISCAIFQTAPASVSVQLVRTPRSRKPMGRSWASVCRVTVCVPLVMGHHLETACPALQDTCSSFSSASLTVPQGTKRQLRHNFDTSCCCRLLISCVFFISNFDDDVFPSLSLSRSLFLTTN